MSKSKRLSLRLDFYPIFAIVMIAVFLIPLVLYGYIGIFTRYVADDYETAGALARSGFWGAQKYWYTTWSGRVSYFALVTLVEMIGIRAIPFLTAVCLLLWLAGLYWVFRQLLGLATIRHPALTAILAASLILFVTLRSLNQIHQILFWQTGLLTYVAYLICFTFGIGLLIRQVRRYGSKPASPIEWLVGFTLAFVIGGLSEISIAFQITAVACGLGLLLLYPQAPFRKKGIGLLIAALVGSILSLLVMALAPGNLVRTTFFAERPGFGSLIFNSLKYMFVFLGNWIDKQPILAALIILVPLITALFTTRPDPRPPAAPDQDRRLATGLLLSGLAIFLLQWSCFFVSFYAMSAPPPDRALVIPQFELVLFIGAWSFWCGRTLAHAIDPQNIPLRFWRILGTGVLAICLLLGPVIAAARIAGTIETSRSLAAEWDRRDAIIRAAVARGEKNVTVWYLRDLNRLGDYSSDPDFLVNRAAADYYHLDTIIALDVK